VHKKLGNTHLALMNFSYASDLDPKGTNNQIKEAINKHYVTDEDEGN
jgi:anaphase-promoting complex subunit 3